jgi:hypothetical protein
MRRVSSMDYTSVHLLQQMHRQLAERSGCLLFSGMPSAVMERRDFETYLKNRGLITATDKSVLIFETLDSALDWMEEKILSAHGRGMARKETPLELGQFDLFRGFNDKELAEITSVAKAVTFESGQRVFSCDDAGDELFLIRRGSFNILLPLKSGKVHHLATMGQGSFFGEVSFLDHVRRSAHAEAKSSADGFVISRQKFNELSRADATIGVLVFARLAKVLALRLRSADAELRSSEER